MRTKLLPAFILAAGCFALVASAQTPAPAEAQAGPAPSRIIYAPRLPSVPELMNVAAAQGLGVERVDQTSNQITVTYKSGTQLSTVVYNLLPSAGASAVASTALQSTAPVAVAAPVQPGATVQGTTVISTTPAPVVVYQQPNPAYYYSDPYYYSPYYYSGYYPWGYYAPVALSFGFGYYYGGYYGHGGGYHGGGGHHGGGGYHGGGGHSGGHGGGGHH